MAEQLSLTDRIAEQLLEDVDKLAEGLAGLNEPMHGTKRITPEQELDLWDYEDTAVDVDALRVEGLNDRTLKLLEDIGVDTRRFDLQAYEKNRREGRPDETWIAALRWPERVKLMTSAGRALSLKKQADYVARMQKRSADRAAERAADAEMEVS